MYINNEIINSGGTLEPTEETKFWVSLWYIPGGYEYDKAEVVFAFFAEEENAVKFEKRNSNPPEMASNAPYDDEAKKRYAEILKSEEEKGEDPGHYNYGLACVSTLVNQ